MSTPAQRGRIGAHASWARTIDRTARTEPGRKGFLARFEREVDPEGVLPEVERQLRAEHARKAYMQRLALTSAARRRKTRTALCANNSLQASHRPSTCCMDANGSPASAVQRTIALPVGPGSS